MGTIEKWFSKFLCICRVHCIFAVVKFILERFVLKRLEEGWPRINNCIKISLAISSNFTIINKMG